jgi:glyoxylase-like metal-dependent hydrolase (beta-lactamase superfamily II)
LAAIDSEDGDMQPHLTRRTFGAGAVGIPLAATMTFGPAHAADETATIHRFDQAIPFPVNAYLIEGREGIVVVDATLTVTSAKGLRRQFDAVGKPLRAVLLTHPHPDHYAGLGILTAGLNVPIVATAGVADVTRRDDGQKNAIIGPMFGDEWPVQRVFPNETATDGDWLDFGPGLRFRVVDIGPAESFHDSLFLLEGRPAAFVGDLAYGLMHSYMADGENDAWRQAIDRLSHELPEDMVLYVGHGAPTTPGLFAWQRTYLDKFEAALRSADWSDPETATAGVVATMKDYLPTDNLVFLMQLSVEPNARRLGLLR